MSTFWLYSALNVASQRLGVNCFFHPMLIEVNEQVACNILDKDKWGKVAAIVDGGYFKFLSVPRLLFKWLMSVKMIMAFG